MKRVFIVEDEAVVALELQDQLERLGFEVCGHAARAAAALERIPEVRPDLVLMDINLGRGLTGIDVADRLRGVIDVPVVFVTAYSDADVTRRAARTEAFAYVVKPFIPDVLRATIDMALFRHDAQRRLREAHQALHASQQLYEGLVEASPVGVFKTDADGEYVFVNSMWCAIAGLTPEAALGDGWIEALHPDDRGPVLAEWRRAVAQRAGFRMEFRFSTPGRPQVWLYGQSSPLRDASGAVIGQIGTITDISARKEAEDALRESRERYRGLFEEAIEGIFQTRADGKILAVNPACARMFGYDSPDEAIGTSAEALYVDPGERGRILQILAEHGRVEGFEARMRKQSGERITVEIFARRLPIGDGESETFQGMIRDVTEHAQHRAALEVLSTGLALLTGEAFYHEVAAQLAAIVDVEIGFVGAFQPGAPARIRTLGLVIDGKEIAAADYEIAGTPCEQLSAKRAAVFPEDVRRLFPRHELLTTLGAEAYVASPIVDSTGRMVGIIGVLARKPLSHAERVLSVVKLFALRVSAEFERAGIGGPGGLQRSADGAPVKMDPSVASVASPTVSMLSLHFTVSRDEEYVELVAVHSGGTIDLKARSHHYLLLLLARIRLESRALPPEEQGWIHQDALLRLLRTDANRLYLDIYRIRRQLAEAGVPDAANIVERRPGTRQLRLGATRVEIAVLELAGAR